MPMASPDLFAHSHSVLNPFLYADIGVADGTATMTVVSLFGQRGDDPWDEAARLARLPAGAAVAKLAAIIAEAPAHPCSLPEATLLAERLVALLPGPSERHRFAAARRLPRLPSLSWSPRGWPPRRWPLGGLATGAAGLAVLVAVVFLWLTLADTLGARGPEDRAFIAEPSAHEISH
jgi:hypothetical protein